MEGVILIILLLLIQSIPSILWRQTLLSLNIIQPTLNFNSSALWCLAILLPILITSHHGLLTCN